MRHDAWCPAQSEVPPPPPAPAVAWHRAVTGAWSWSLLARDGAAIISSPEFATYEAAEQHLCLTVARLLPAYRAWRDRWAPGPIDTLAGHAA